MAEKGLPRAAEDSGNLPPGVEGAHIDNPDRLDPRLWRFYPKEARELAALHTAPELAFGCDNKVLIQRVGTRDDFDPFAAAGDHGEDSTSSRNHPHIVLQLRHVLFCRGFL